MRGGSGRAPSRDEIEDQLERHGAFYGRVGGLGALEDLVYARCEVAMTNFTVFLQLLYNSFMTVDKLPDMLYTVQAGYEGHNTRDPLWDAGRPGTHRWCITLLFTQLSKLFFERICDRGYSSCTTAYYVPGKFC